MNRLDLAHQNFEIALAYNPAYAPSLAGKGRIAQMQKDWPQAIQYFQSAYEIDKSVVYKNLLIEVYLDQASTFLNNGNTEKAAAPLKKAYKLCPTTIATLLLLAKFHTNDPETALKYYDEALELNDDNVEALKGKGAFLLKEKRMQECIPFLEKARKLAPDQHGIKAMLYNAYKLLAKASRNAGELTQACSYYTLALTLNPGDHTVIYKRGKTHYELGAYNNALEDLNSSLELEKDSPKTLAYLGATLLKVKYFTASIKALNKADHLEPNNSFILTQLKIAHHSLFNNLRRI